MLSVQRVCLCCGSSQAIESLLKPSGFCTVSPGLTIRNATLWPQSVFPYFVWISEQTAIISVYSISWLVFITETECVYCAVRAGAWNKKDCVSSLQGWCTLQQQRNVFVCLFVCRMDGYCIWRYFLTKLP